MANVDKFTEPKAMFLRAADVMKTPTSVFKITGEGTLVTSEKFGNERLHIPGTFNAEEKVFDCSKTNARTIQEALGSDTVKWINSELTLETFKTRTSDGKMTDAINVKQVKKP